MPTSQYDVIILGAGASGLAAAAVASCRGRRVLLLDHAARPGIKVLLAGGGKANFTNKLMGEEFFHSVNPKFVRSALHRFTPQNSIDWATQAGIAIEEREHGQVFCSRSAKDLCRLLIASCNGCDLSLNESISSVTREDNSFIVTTKNRTARASSLVIALGNRAWPQAGATNLGLRLARQFGHKVLEPQPALVGLTMPPDWHLAQMEGLSVPVCLTVPKGKKTLSFTLPLLFTHTGISGPAVLQASLYWQPGEKLLCDFLPNQPLTELFSAREHGKLLVKSLFRRYFPERLAMRLCANTGPEVAESRVAELSRARRMTLQESVHTASLAPLNYEGFAKAEAARGGVSTEHVQSKSMESTLVPGLFFCGEVLDVTGRVGGYNLHWAFASGRAAGAFA